MKLILCMFFVLLLATPAFSTRPPDGSHDSLILTLTDALGPGGFVEQQSPPGDSTAGWMTKCGADPSTCVVNQTGCVWTTDDRVTYGGYGILDPGASASSNLCLVADWVGHILGFSVHSNSSDLAVTVCYQPQDQCFSSTARSYGHDFEYRGCIVGPSYPGRRGGPYDPRLQVIADSNNGVGVETQITVTIQNPTANKLRNVGAQFVIGSNEPNRQSIYCQGGDPGGEFGIDDIFWQVSI